MSLDRFVLISFAHCNLSRFLRTHLQVEALTSSRSLSDLKRTLNRLPSGVEEMYRNMWRRILDQGEEKALLAKRILVWLTYGPPSPTIQLLQHALAVDPETGVFDDKKFVEEKLLSSVCCGLISINGETQVIQFIRE